MSRQWVIIILMVGGAVLAEKQKPLTPEIFARVAPLKTPAKGSVYYVDLTEEVYQTVFYDDLRDLRVFNKQNQLVPFSFQLKSGEEVHQTEQFDLKFFPVLGEKNTQYGLESHIEWGQGGTSGNATVKFAGKNSAKLEKRGYLVDLRKIAFPIRSVELDWVGAGENSFVNVSVESSDDLKGWASVVGPQSLAKFTFGGETLAQRNIDLPSIKANYLRITWDGNKVFNLKKISGEFSKSSWADTKRHFTKVLASASNQQEFFYEKSPVVADRINVSLPDPNTVVRVEITSRDHNQAMWRNQYEGLLYRVSRDEGELVSPPVRIPSNSDRYWRVRVVGKDATIGKNGPELEFGWISHRLFFLAHGEEPFKLAWGLKGANEADFGLGSTVREITLQGNSVKPVVAELGEVRVQTSQTNFLDSPHINPIPWGQYGLWAGLTLVLFVTGFMAYRLFKDMNG